jgi:hypothetical protein
MNVAAPIILLLSLLPALILTQSSSLNINITTLNYNAAMIVNGTSQPLFISTDSTFDCSLSPLFNYTQNEAEYNTNANYSIVVSGLSQPNSFSMSTVHETLRPTLNQTTCLSPSCTISIQNHCHLPNVNFFNYFDELVLSVSDDEKNYTLNYYVICNDQYVSNTFEWGLLIEIVFITALIAVVAVYSRAWSFRGMGLTIRVWLIILFNVLLILGGLIGFFSSEGIIVTLNIVSFVLGIVGVTICCN